jgi:calcineurin-like phosphoesterase family protein
MSRSKLTFLQLSDVHFRSAGDNEEIDDVEAEGNALDYSLRELLVDDARNVVDAVGGASGVLVCGDLANAGNGSEFTQAGTWLQNLCSAIGVPPWLVWSVPGNHDITRTRIGESQNELRERIRTAPDPDAGELFAAMIASDVERSALLEPLHNYLEFASAYDCMFDATLHWNECIDLGGQKLRIRGLTSALLCGPGDNTSTRRSIIGDAQADIAANPHSIHYTLCHHPQPWLMDREEIEEWFKQRVAVRVTGHLHVRKFEDTAAGVYLKAGAVSPKRQTDLSFREPEIPRYEVISLFIEETEDAKVFEVYIQGRVWNESMRAWGPDTGEFGSVGRRFVVGEDRPGVPVADAPVEAPERLERPKRELRYRLAQLQPYDRIECAQKIGAPLDRIIQAPSHLQVEELVRWADPDALGKLWVAVAEATPELDPSESPF